MSDFTIGVEEEFLLVDVRTRELRPDGADVLGRARSRVGEEVDPELLRPQVEVGTPVCVGLAEVRTEVARLRAEVAEAAADVGCRVLATGTYPGRFEPPPITEKRRYHQIADMFGGIAGELVVCGCHVHVAIADRELAVAVLRRSRAWLPALLALSANSPFWRGEDTRYASFRWQVWSRLPSVAPPPPVRSRGEYDELVTAMLATGVIRDRGMLHWLVRPSHRYDTLEFRIADTCRSSAETVLLAGLVRALAVTCAREEADGRTTHDPHPEVLRAGLWRAARFGLDGDLLDPTSGRPEPAARVVAGLIEHVRPALEEWDDVAEVTALADVVLTDGTGAARQRAAYRRGGIEGTVDSLSLP